MARHKTPTEPQRPFEGWHEERGLGAPGSTLRLAYLVRYHLLSADELGMLEQRAAGHRVADLPISKSDASLCRWFMGRAKGGERDDDDRQIQQLEED